MESRSDWGAAPPKNPLIPWNPAALDGVTFHWFASPKAASSHTGCPALLRSVQRSHQAGEYIDIAYNIGVCPHGEVYELRGYRHKSGANGTTDANNRYLSIVYMAGVGDPLTEKGKLGLRAAAQGAFKLGVKQTAHLHQEFVSTSCPGPAVTKWVKAGGWKAPENVTLWEVDWATNVKDGMGRWKRRKDETKRPRVWLAAHPGALQRGGVYFRPKRED